MQCSICLDDLEGGPTLVCGHRFHASCLARLAGANGTTPTRRGALTTCPQTVNFPGEAPLASALASLPVAPAAPAVAPPRRSGRAPAPKVIVDPEAPARKKARTFSENQPYYGKIIEGARQKKSGKWSNTGIFPGREFDDLDAYRAAKRQHMARRAAYLDQIPEWQKK